jgi:hypothetical protein
VVIENNDAVLHEGHGGIVFRLVTLTDGRKVYTNVPLPNERPLPVIFVEVPVQVPAAPSLKRNLPMTRWVTARDVVEHLGLKRSLAYKHLLRAAGQNRKKGTALRVPIEVWESYAKKVFGSEVESKWPNIYGKGMASGTGPSISTAAASSGPPAARRNRQLGPFSPTGSTDRQIRIVQPRTTRLKPR